MKMKIKGLTDAIIILNKIGIPVQGKSETLINVASEDQEKELKGLIKANLVEIVDVIENDDLMEYIASSKNKKSEEEKVKEAEKETQKMGNTVTIGTGSGTIKTKMVKSASEDVVETERTKASIEAMKKLEEEEREAKFFEDEKHVDEEKTNNKAIVMGEQGEMSVNMANSIIPESQTIRKTDPFIDREKNDEIIEKKEKKNKSIKKSSCSPDKKKKVDEDDVDEDLFISGENDDDLDDPFIEC